MLTECLCRWSVGSVLFLLSWAVLMGPWSYARHLVSGPRLPFTAAYFGSIGLTLYFAIGVSLFVLILVSFFVNHQVHTHPLRCTFVWLHSTGEKGNLAFLRYIAVLHDLHRHAGTHFCGEGAGLLSITPHIIGFCATMLLQQQNLAPLQSALDTPNAHLTVPGTSSLQMWHNFKSHSIFPCHAFEPPLLSQREPD